MRNLFFLILIVFSLVSCKDQNTASDENIKIEKSIYLLKSNIKHDENGVSGVSGVSVVFQSADTIFFCKGFWKVFMNKFPSVASKIFESNGAYQWGIITVGDTTLETKIFDSTKIVLLRTQLPWNLYGKELIDTGYPNKLLLNAKFQNDTSLLSVGKLNNKISKDYSDFIKLMNDTTINEITIFCKKEFLNNDIFKHQ